MQTNTHEFYNIRPCVVNRILLFILCFVLRSSCSGSVSGTSSTTKNSCGCSIPWIQIGAAPTVYTCRRGRETSHRPEGAKIWLTWQSQDWGERDVGFNFTKGMQKWHIQHAGRWSYVFCLTHLIIDSGGSWSRKIRGPCTQNLRISGITLNQTCGGGLDPTYLSFYDTNPNNAPVFRGTFPTQNSPVHFVASKLNKFDPS